MDINEQQDINKTDMYEYLFNDAPKDNRSLFDTINFNGVLGEKHICILENKEEDYISFNFFNDPEKSESIIYSNINICNSPCRTETINLKDSQISFSFLSDSSAESTSAIKKGKKDKLKLKDEEARKRLKIHFFKKILKKLNSKLEKPYQLKRLPQNYIKNLAIEENKME